MWVTAPNSPPSCHPVCLPRGWLQGKLGSPEKPLSDLGKLSYRSFWAWELLQALAAARGTLPLARLSELTHIAPDDVANTLQALGLLRYWKGQHIVCTTPRLVDEHLRARRCVPSVCLSVCGGSSVSCWRVEGLSLTHPVVSRPPLAVVHRKALRWSPPVFEAT